jgi:4-amino-4-deoxy-L-arabinose transferase-like glycosyltransferase
MPHDPQDRTTRPPRWALGILLLGASLAVATTFAQHLDREPDFVDEWAYVSQVYFGPLLLHGRDDPRWLEYPGYDLPPLPKFLIAGSLTWNGYKLPGRDDMARWYNNTSTRFGSQAMLVAARWPSVVLGVIGCLALYAIAVQVLPGGTTPFLAMILLAVSPLYHMHARRAMSDVPTEAFTLAACALALAGWMPFVRGRRSAPAMFAYLASAGVMAGLAVLSKLSGGLAAMILAAWWVWLLVRPGSTRRQRLLIAASGPLAAAVALAVFVALNPFVTARPKGPLPRPLAQIAARGPIGRIGFLLDHRVSVSQRASELFPADATTAITEKLAAVAVQGFGRFGVFGHKLPVAETDRRDAVRHRYDFDSRIRYDWRQDFGAVVWLPLVVAGVVILGRRAWAERRTGQPSADVAFLIQCAVTLVTVTAFLPLAWDRYFLPLQAPACLLGAVAIEALVRRLATINTERGLAVLVGLTVLVSLAYYWPSRDWNVSSRLMLTYAIVDRGTVTIDGLEDHTRDRAHVGGHFYSDKSPGMSLAGVPAYTMVRMLGIAPAHPLNVRGEGFTHWWADYWVTLLTSGLATAVGAGLLTLWSLRLGVRPAGAAIVGLAYGLGTPAFVYGTLFYGHQLAAVMLLGALAIVEGRANRPGRGLGPLLAAGFLSGYATLTELPMGLVAAIVLGRLVSLAVSRRVPVQAIGAFLVGAIPPALMLVGYNMLAFGSPLSLGYFHEDLREFSRVHSSANPLGLQLPDLTKMVPLLFSPARGLFVFAPILLLAPVGWWRMGRVGGRPGLALTSLGIALAVFGVNLSYPEWTGGWATGPRLLVPLLPFSMLGVAGFLVEPCRRWRIVVSAILALAGAGLMLLYAGAGGRVPHTIAHPLRDFVWPVWQAGPQHMTRTLIGVLDPERVAQMPPGLAWVQLLPLVGFQLVALVLVGMAADRLTRRPDSPATAEAGDRAP